MARLTLTTESGTTHSIDLEEEAYSIGRAGDCEIQIEDLSLSGHHARLERREDGWHLIELGSTNGSKVNGLEVADDQILRHDDAIALGDVTGFFTDLSDVSRTQEMPGHRQNHHEVTALDEAPPVAARTVDINVDTPANAEMAWRLVTLLAIAVFALAIALAVALLLLWLGDS